MNNNKYQVFISSTYADLIEERKNILDVLFMADCIPAGMEYDYAIERGIPVLVFAIDDNIELASDKIETDENKIEKLIMFRTKAMTNRLASIWGTPKDLTGKLAVSIMKAKIEIKRPGWQRAVDFDEASLRREIMELKNENKQLADDLKIAREEISFLTEETDIAFEDCEVKIEYHYRSQSGL